ncbi:MAG TPA: DNA cytosine methyltransferase, partial [Solirubrobacterales bacterium]|nr:DNA cytosine methyltransferase [Solirubrobacterales bacterium]
GGSSLGAELAGAELRLGLNHWPRAIETHSTNFEHADHDCNDVSALSTARIRGYPCSDILLASPECTNHSLAKGGKRLKPQASSLFDDGPAGDDEAERSRATMWDVVRFADQKRLQGRPYKAIVVENVPDAFWWGPERKGYPNGDGTLFDAWLMAMRALDYEHEILWLNSMFAGPLMAGRAVPQSRDRMYVVFWRKGARAPNLKVEPLSWCPACDVLVDGRQTFKQLSLRRSAGRPWGKYGQQYFYTCPTCNGTVFPGAVPAAEAIDWTLPIERIGDRKRPLEQSTRGRIRRGLERVANEPFAMRIGGTGNPKPLTLPLLTQTARHEAAMVFPNAGNTFERTPGNRARDAACSPLDTLHGTLDRAMVVPPMGDVPARPAGELPAPTQSTTTRPGLVMANTENGVPRPLDHAASQTLRTEGGLSLVLVDGALVMRNNGDSSGEQSTPALEPIRTLTGKCHQSLVIPYYRTGSSTDPERSPTPTVPTKERLALLVPYTREARLRRVDSEAAPTVATEGPPAVLITEEDIDNCLFRMFDLPEIAKAMAMYHHVDGAAEYLVTGNRRERMAQYGNAVTPPAMELIVSRLLEVIA